MSDPRIDRGQLWIRAYLNRLLTSPPAGAEVEFRRARSAPGVRVTQDGRTVLECWAYDDYIRAAVHQPSEDLQARIASLPSVDSRLVARSGYLTVYVRQPAGLRALGWALGDPASPDEAS